MSKENLRKRVDCNRDHPVTECTDVLIKNKIKNHGKFLTQNNENQNQMFVLIINAKKQRLNLISKLFKNTCLAGELHFFIAIIEIQQVLDKWKSY